MQKSIINNSNKRPVRRHLSAIFTFQIVSLLLTLLTVVTLNLFAIRVARAQAPPPQVSAQELIKRVSETYTNLKTYSLEGVMVEKNESLALKSREESRIERPISIVAQSPGKLRMETWFGPTLVTVISDGKSLWLYAPKEKEYIKRDDTSELTKILLTRGAPTALIDLYKNLAQHSSEAKLLREETITAGDQQISCYVVELGSTTEAASQVETDTFWIDKKMSLVWRSQSIKRTSVENGDYNRSESNVNYSAIRINEPIEDTLFAFTSPAGVKEVESDDEKASLVGREPKDFTLTSFDGKAVNLKTLRGRVVMITFWASWCGFCAQQLPEIDKLYREFKDRGLVVLGINREADIPKEKEAAHARGYTFPTLIDAGSRVAEQYHVNGIPMTVIIGKEGKIVAHLRGMTGVVPLREALAKAGFENNAAPTSEEPSRDQF